MLKTGLEPEYAKRLVTWLKDDFEDLGELPDMFSGVECVMTRSGKVIHN